MPSSKGGVSLPQLAKAEEVVRYERERREAKQRLVLLDSFLSELDEQLLCVAQFKKEWLRHRESLEEDRQNVVKEESNARPKQEKELLQLLRHLYKEGKARIEKRKKKKS